MYPQTHFLFPFFIGLILTEFHLFSWESALLAGILGVLIDLDHLIEHVIYKRKNKFSLRDTWNQAVHYHWLVERSFIHHWRGVLLVSLIMPAIFLFSREIVLVLGLGYYSHIFLDHLSDQLGKLKKKTLKLKERGFFIEMPYYELGLDLALVSGTITVLLI